MLPVPGYRRQAAGKPIQTNARRPLRSYTQITPSDASNRALNQASLVLAGRASEHRRRATPGRAGVRSGLEQTTLAAACSKALGAGHPGQGVPRLMATIHHHSAGRGSHGGGMGRGGATRARPLGKHTQSRTARFNLSAPRPEPETRAARSPSEGEAREIEKVIQFGSGRSL